MGFIVITTKRAGTPSELSPRLRQVLELALRGLAEKQIASELKLSRHTVNDHMKALYQRFDVHSRGELMARFIKSQSVSG